MKTQIKLTVTALVALAVTAVSCKKEIEQPTPGSTEPTKTQLLTAKNWKIISTVSNGTDWYPIMPACQKDDFLVFKADGTGALDAGTVKCHASEPQTEPGTWKFISKETQILMDNTDTMKVMKLTADTLRVEKTFEEDGQQVTSLVTFVPVK